MYKGVTPAPERRFVKDLKAYDDKLFVEFDRRFERFVIRRKTTLKPYPDIWVVQGEQGEFRQPDQRDMVVLWMADLWKNGGVRKRIEDGEEKILAAREKEEADIAQNFRDATKDNKYQLRNAYRKASNDGKVAPHTRRVDPKPKGKVFK